MNISGIRPETGFYDYNAIKFRPEVTSVDLAEVVGNSKPVSFDDPSAEVDLSDEGIALAREKQTFDAFDFANQYKPGEVFELKGDESDIKSLDVERAVSEMRKDSLIHQYQYFVGDKLGQNENSFAIRGNEDFSL